MHQRGRPDRLNTPPFGWLGDACDLLADDRPSAEAQERPARSGQRLPIVDADIEVLDAGHGVARTLERALLKRSIPILSDADSDNRWLENRANTLDIEVARSADSPCLNLSSCSRTRQ